MCAPVRGYRNPPPRCALLLRTRPSNILTLTARTQVRTPGAHACLACATCMLHDLTTRHDCACACVLRFCACACVLHACASGGATSLHDLTAHPPRPASQVSLIVPARPTGRARTPHPIDATYSSGMSPRLPTGAPRSSGFADRPLLHHHLQPRQHLATISAGCACCRERERYCTLRFALGAFLIHYEPS